MRELHDHKTNQANEQLKIEVMDEPGSGGANHVYKISHTETDPSKSFESWCSFQNGPIPEKGINGITSEALLAILIDRHRGFASGQFPSKENSMAVTYLESALLWLQKRTNDRIRRGVEGKLEK